MADHRPVALQHWTVFGDDPIDRARIFLGDGPDAERSTQWISGQLKIETIDSLKSLSLLRIATLTAMRDLINAEIRRLEEHYNEDRKALR